MVESDKQSIETNDVEIEFSYREDIGLVEYPAVKYEHSYFTDELKEELTTLYSEWDEILGREHTGEEVALVRKKIDKVASKKVTKRIELGVLDGAGLFPGRKGKDFKDQVNIRMKTIFQEEEGDKELEELVQLKQRNPHLQIKMVVADGGTFAKWDPDEPVIVDSNGCIGILTMNPDLWEI